MSTLVLSGRLSVVGLFIVLGVVFSSLSHVTGFSSGLSQSVWGRTDSNKGSVVGSTSQLFVYSAGSQSFEEWEQERRQLEFMDLGDLEETDTRRKRVERDSKIRERFAEFGDELWELRKELKTLSKMLIQAMAKGNNKQELGTVRDQLRSAERKDPELTYEIETLEAEAAEMDGRIEKAAEHKKRALAARTCLPQYNLEGLWIGKYGSHGYEMINITYVGDTLIAYKVTGDKNVPRGEITFQADLSPIPKKQVGLESSDDSNLLEQPGNPSKKRLPPIQLSEKAAKKWGTGQLPRYKGLGQVAEAGFQNQRWMDGQLIMIGKEYFSFAWVPIEQQIFFGRPSPELALKMLRDGGIDTLREKKSWDNENPPSIDDDIDVLKSYALSCLEMTDEKIDDHGLITDQDSCIWYGENLGEGCFE